MKNILHKTLEKLDGYLISIERNTETSMYELRVGLKAGWIFKSTDNINCEVDIETDSGSIVIISGKHDDVVIDHLVAFVERIIDHNNKIAKMKEEFDNKLMKEKERLEKEVIEFNTILEKQEDFDIEIVSDDEEDEETIVEDVKVETSNDISNIKTEEIEKSIT